MAKKYNPKKKGVKKNYLFEEIIKVLSKSPNKAFNYKQIAAEMNISDHSQRLLISSILAELKNADTVSEPERGKFKIKTVDKFISGKVDMTSSGIAYIVSDESEDDILINPKKTFLDILSSTGEPSIFKLIGNVCSSHFLTLFTCLATFIFI